MTDADRLPLPVRRIITALVGRAVARCAAEGIALGDWYAALLIEQAAHPTVTVSELFDLAFARVRRGGN